MATNDQIYAAIRAADAAGDGDSVRKLAAYLQVQKAQDMAPPARDPTDGMSGTDKFFAGVGKGMTDVVRGIGQVTGLESQADIDAAKQQDAPLMATGAGRAGDITGSVAATLPAALIPGANTVLGASVIGAGLGAAQPVATGESRLQNTALGAAGGAGGVALGKGLGKAVSALGGSAQAPAISQAVQGAQQAGYVIPPTQANPTALNKIVEGLSGKIQTAQNASARNAPVTNSLAATALGLPKDTQITLGTLQQIRQQAGAAYDAIGQTGTVTPGPAYDAALDKIAAPFKQAQQGFPNAKASPVIDLVDSLRSPSFDAASAVAKIKELRSAADDAFRTGNTDVARASKSAAGALEQALDDHLQQAGNPQALADFRDARQLIAKTYSVEKALNDSTGTVDAGKLAQQLAKGKPLSGDLKTAAQFAQAFPKAAQTPERMGSLPQNSPLDWALAGGLGAAAHSTPIGLATMAARPMARKLALSSLVQGRLASPPNANLTRLGSLIQDNSALALPATTPLSSFEQ